MVIYAPGTEETDQKKQNISLQQNSSANATNAANIATNTTNITTNTTNISALQTKTTGYESAWTAFTPTVTPSSGAITTLVASVHYKQNGKTVFFSVDINITTNGAGAGLINCSLPFTSGSTLSVINGKEVAGVTSKMCGGFINSGSTNIQITNYDGTYPGANGTRLVMSGVIESA